MSPIEFPEGSFELGPALKLRWHSGRVQSLSAAYLRARCPCELCRSAAIKLEPSMFPGLEVRGSDFVGNYALQLKFSDGHQHGAYSYNLLESMPDEA